MSLDYINEAFRSLESLNEDIFSVDHDGINELSDFMSSDVDDEEKISIIDMDAETEDDLQDSYVGKIICDCNVCHSHVFKDKDQITIDEEGVVDIEDDCPYCGEHNGFVIIGEIAEFNPNAEEEVAEETPAEEEEVTEDPTEEFDDEASEIEEVEEEEVLDESLNESKNNTVVFIDASASMIPYQNAARRLANRYNANKVFYFASEVGEAADKVGYTTAADKVVKYIKEHPGYDYVIITDDDTEIINSELKNLPNVEIVDASTAEDDEARELALKNAEKNISAEQRARNKSKIAKLIGDTDESLNEAAPRKFKPHTMKLLRMIGSDLVNDAVEEKLEESFNNVSIETDDQKMTMTSEENGKVTVTTEPIEAAPIAEEGEMIAPISDETQDEIIDATAEVAEEEPAEEAADETPAEEEEMDFDFDELDEEGMDELGESYLKRVYENVDSFKTSSVSTAGNRLFIEGMINFKSGASKKTGFIFEAKEATRDGKVKFMGENAHLCRGKRAFTLAGSLNENKLMVESLTYNYRAKNNEGKSTRVYGTISRNK